MLGMWAAGRQGRRQGQGVCAGVVVFGAGPAGAAPGPGPPWRQPAGGPRRWHGRRGPPPQPPQGHPGPGAGPLPGDPGPQARRVGRLGHACPSPRRRRLHCRPPEVLGRGSPHHRRSPMSGHRDHPVAATLRPARAHPGRLRHPAGRHPHWSPAMTTGPVLSEPAAEAAIGAACQVLHLPTVAAQAVELADQAARERLTHRAYLAELLSAETDTRDARRRDRRVKEAKFPRVKRLADFDLSAAPGVASATLAALASGTWIDHGTPLVLLGDSGTGKSHLLIGVGVAACEQGRAVRYVTCAALVNELVEAADERTLAKTIGRYARLDLLCCDELGYLHLDPRGAELLFQIITEREERASIAVASNAPFSEWGQTFTDPRLAAAVVDRLTFNAHIIQTGTQSYRLRATTSRKKGAATD